MIHSSSFWFLAFALFIFACLSSCADTDNKDDGKQAVEQAKQAIKAICDKAKNNIGNAKGALDKIQQFNEATEESKSQAAEVLSQAKAAAEKNEEATAILENIKNSADMVSTLHKSATDDLTNTVASLSAWLSETETLKDKCDTELLVIQKSLDNYEDTSENASYIKNQKAEKLDSYSTDASKITSVVDSTEEQIKQSLTNAQLKNLHINVIVAVAKIEKMIKEVDSNIEETENKKDEVNRIVKEMNKHCTTPYAESNTIIKALCDSAKEAFTSATGAVDKAKKAKDDIGKQQDPANTALKHFQGSKALSETPNELAKAKGCVAKVKEIEDQLQTALETANNAVANANDAKKNLETALSTTTTEPNTEQNTETEKSDPSVGQGREPHQQDKAIQPTSTDSPDQSKKSEEKLKDALIKGAQNVPTTALTGGKAPAPGANNDSAMTVSVPLLVALISSAVLQ